MIAAQVVVSFGLAPRNTHRGDQGAFENLVFVREQNTSAQAIKAAFVAGVLVEFMIGIDDGSFPLLDIVVPVFVEWRSQRLKKLGGAAWVTLPHGNRHDKFVATAGVDLAHERDVSVFGGAKFPIHPEIPEVLPAVAGTNEADGTPGETVGAAHDQMKAGAFGVKEFTGADLDTITGIVRTVAVEVWGNQRVQAQFVAQRFVHDLHLGVNQQN